MSNVDRRRPSREAFTLVELLVVVAIISLLVAMLTPAVQIARASARQSQCQHNMRQIGVGMQAHASRTGSFCSGAFDWKRDGCVTSIGWVADLVNSGIPVGEMLCPSNPIKISSVYAQLLNLDAADVTNDCVDMEGNSSKSVYGSLIENPCFEIYTDLNSMGGRYSPGTEDRRLLVEKKVYEKFYNTNYTASWFLVRSGVQRDADGNLAEQTVGCGKSLLSREATEGPLSVVMLDNSALSGNFVPILADGGASIINLPQQIGEILPGSLTTVSFSQGPVLDPSMSVPSFPVGTGVAVWGAKWAINTLQDYRSFGPVHRGKCNILFGDGSVRSFLDENGDGLLNNGFQPDPANLFLDGDVIELPLDRFASRYSLLDKAAQAIDHAPVP